LSDKTPAREADTFKRKVLDLLKKKVEGVTGPVYADLSGRTLQAEDYQRLLESDASFALDQVELAISAMPTASPTQGGITPTEQRWLAQQIGEYVVERHVDGSEALRAFLRTRPALVATLSVDDCQRIAKTLRFEFGIHTEVPDSLDEFREKSPMKPDFVESIRLKIGKIENNVFETFAEDVTLAMQGLAILAKGTAEEPVSVSQIATQGGVEERTVKKVFEKLKRAKILRANKGVGSTFTIARPVDKITMKQVYTAVSRSSERLVIQSGPKRALPKKYASLRLRDFL